MPDGYPVFKIIKNDERTTRIRVVIFTTTDNLQEVSRCCEFGYTVYVTKPIEYDQFSDAIRVLGLFLSIVKVPEKE